MGSSPWLQLLLVLLQQKIFFCLQALQPCSPPKFKTQLLKTGLWTPSNSQLDMMVALPGGHNIYRSVFLDGCAMVHRLLLAELRMF